jgi:hypothetical protein
MAPEDYGVGVHIKKKKHSAKRGDMVFIMSDRIALLFFSGTHVLYQEAPLHRNPCCNGSVKKKPHIASSSVES